MLGLGLMDGTAGAAQAQTGTPTKPAGQDKTPVATTRTGLPADDQAVAVEMLRRDAIEAATLPSPGDVARSFGEISGLRVRTTSPELGLAMVRIQGLPGQYTRLLSDGAPLYFDHPGGLAILQIPPMDLERVEVIQGSASALFGANATSGVVNLLSRRPGTGPNREFLFNQSTQNATDGQLWLASPAAGPWSRTLLVSANRQSERDVDGDGWSDIAGYSRGAARQRVFWNNGRGRSASGTAGVTFEKRRGGSAFAHQDLETKAADGVLSGQMPLGRYILTGTGTLYVQSRVRDFADVREHERREDATIELALHGSAPRQTWVAGLAVDWFTIRTPTPLVSAYVAPRGGIFLHDDLQVAPWLSVSGSMRFDYSKGAGETLRVDSYFVSPRGSALVHRGPWAARFSAGRSYYTPSPLMEETEAAGYARLTIAGPIEIETARSVSAGLTHETGASVLGVTVFHAQIDHPALIDRATYTLHTAADPLVSRGLQIHGTVRRAPISVTGKYAYLQARQDGGRDVALTPQHRADVVASVAIGSGRIAARVDFTGSQRLDANPYRTRGEPFTTLGLLGERRFGRLRLFVNGDNLTNVRQTDWDPLARPGRDVDGRWTVDAWAPLSGRVINGGIRVGF